MGARDSRAAFAAIPTPVRTSLEFNPYQLGLVSDSMTFRRQDIYDDSGR